MDHKPVIMIAEADRDLLWLYKRWLEEAGYFVRPAEDGAWALAQIVPDPPDLLLVDLRMPDLSGFEVCRQLRARDQNDRIPIIAMTVQLDPGIRSRAERCGFDGVLMKPFSRTELIAHVQRILGPPRAQELDDRIQALELKVLASLGDDS